MFDGALSRPSTVCAAGVSREGEVLLGAPCSPPAWPGGPPSFVCYPIDNEDVCMARHCTVHEVGVFDVVSTNFFCTITIGTPMPESGG